MDLRIEPVASPRDLRRFILYPWRLYRGRERIEQWVPPLLLGEKDLFNLRKNPFWMHAECQHFLAYRGREIVGRVSGIVDQNYVHFHEEQTGFLGFFEAIDDPVVAGALFEAACGWVRGRGMSRIMGPMNPSADHILGVLVDSFDIPPIVQMGYNPPYYPALYERHGFTTEKNLLCFRLLVSRLPVSDKIRRVAEISQKRRNLALRTIDMKNFKQEVERIRDLYNAAWGRNWGFVPWTREEFDWMSNDLRLVGDPRVVLLVEAEGRLVGVSVPIPDVNQILIRMNGRLFPFGIFRLLLERRKIDILRMAIMGVRDEYQNQGIDALMVYETYRRGVELGYKGAELSWILESNYSLVNLLKNWGAEQYRTYRVYGKDLG